VTDQPPHSNKKKTEEKWSVNML